MRSLQALLLKCILLLSQVGREVQEVREVRAVRAVRMATSWRSDQTALMATTR